MAAFFNIIKGVVGGIEVAPYEVVEKTEHYEKRLYPAKKWVRTTMEADSMDGCSSTMFNKLFKYISGQNSQNVAIEMTAPVSVYMESGAGSNSKDKFTMAFYVPEIYQQSPPVPTDPSVSIEERQEFTVFSRMYGGFSRGETTKIEHDKLLASLSEDDRKTVNAGEPYFFAGYDAPFKLFNRRNEIWLESRQEAKADA